MKTPKDNLHIYCPDTIRKKLHKLAEANHRSMSAEVQMLIDEAYAKRFPPLIAQKEPE